MEYKFSKRKELSEQLTNWWRTQTEFKTKKTLANFLRVHPDTLGDYFSGRAFPRLDIATRLYELTKIVCLKANGDGDSISGMVPQEASPSPPPSPPSPSSVAAPIEKPKEFLGEEGRYKERAVVISLERTICPFCAHDIAKFRSCVNCGQQFVWANVPLEHEEPL